MKKQLLDLGFTDLQEFDQFFRYFGENRYFGFFDTYGSKNISDVKKSAVGYIILCTKTTATHGCRDYSMSIALVTPHSIAVSDEIEVGENSNNLYTKIINTQDNENEVVVTLGREKDKWEEVVRIDKKKLERCACPLPK